MYSEELNKDTASVLDNDIDNINNLVDGTSFERKTFLQKIAGLQAFCTLSLWWVGIPFPYNASGFPLLIGAFLLMFDLGISRMKAQKIAKALFYYGLWKSVFMFLVFVIYLVSSFHETGETTVHIHGPIGLLFVSVLNMIAEGASTFYILRVVRLTNEVIGLLARKMSRGIAEADFKYEC